jgi:hypothetical protein
VDTVESDQVHTPIVVQMDTVESDLADRPIIVQLARVTLVAVMITIAIWLVTNYALDLLGVSFSK